MSQDTNIENLIINKLTKAQYENIENPDPTQLYFITDEVISSTDVTNALGYTPYNSSNPNGYTSNVGTVTSVNNIQPDTNGNVAISTRNVGEVITSTLPLTDAGLHLLDGSLLQYGIYKEFIDYIADLYAEKPNANYFCTESEWQSSVTQYGVCGKFVYSPNDNTVRLPKITGIIEGTTDLSALGELVEAGLPNITGELDYIDRNTNVAGQGLAGAFYDNGLGVFTGSTASNGRSNIGFDASRSSSLYKNNFNKVQPQTVKLLYYIVIATSTKTDVQVDIDKVATDLNGKADTDLTNTTDTGYNKMAGASMPSDKYIDLTLGASGTTYRAPANGWYTLGKNPTAQNQYISMGNINSQIVATIWSTSAQAVRAFVPVLKNDIVIVEYTANGTTEYFRFIYAQGSESEAS